MKKSTRKLVLRKQTVRTLDGQHLAGAVGGLDWKSLLQLCPQPTVGCPRTTTL